MLLPLEVTLLANVQTIRDARLDQLQPGLVLPFAATAFGTFLIRQGFRGCRPRSRTPPGSTATATSPSSGSSRCR
jgi:ABC-type glycerol-3-phosphate transport system permease component